MTAPLVAWVGVGTNAGKVLTCDTLTAAWVGLTTALNTSTVVEGTSSQSDKVSNTALQGYTVNATDIIGVPFAFHSEGGNYGDHIFGWINSETWSTLALGGYGIVIADDLATDSWGVWYTGPQSGFLGGWYAYVINPAAVFNEVTAGTAVWTLSGNPAQLSGVDGFGVRWKTIKASTSDNCFVDSFAVGTGYGITLGDAGSTEGKFLDFITFEEVTTTGRYGGVRGISGIVFAKCKLYIGAVSGSTNTEFIDSGFTVVWEKAVLSDGTSPAVATTFYQLGLRKGTGTTDVTLSSGSFVAVSPHEVYMQLTGATSCAMTNINVDRARLIDVDGAVNWNGGQITNSGQFTITAGTPTLQNLTLRYSTDAVAMSISTASMWANVSNIAFVSGGTGYAIEGFSTEGSYTFTNLTFSGYGANGTTNAAIHVLDSNPAHTVAISIVGGDTPSYHSEGASVTFPSSVILTMTVKGTVAGIENQPIEGATAFIDQELPEEPWVMNEFTNASGIATESWTGGAVPNAIWRVRKYGYIPFQQIVSISSSDISLPVTLVVDGLVL